jgi:hypothetical protein
MMKKILALVFFVILASSARGQTITQQPASQTVQVGQTAVFTATVSGGPCRSAWYANYALTWGPIASTFTYKIPNVTLAMNGWPIYIDLWACGTAGTSLGNSQIAVLTVVAAPVLQSIVVTPPTATIGIGEMQAFVATGTYSGGSTRDVSSSATWASDTPTVATVIAGGVATGVAMGTAKISATMGGIAGSTMLTVQPLITVSVSVAYNDGTIPTVEVDLFQVVTNPDQTTTSTQILHLVPDSTGNASGQFLMNPALTYEGVLVLNGAPVGQPLSYPGALVLAAMPQISKVNFGVVMLKASAIPQVKSFTSGAS